jgi:hypothetical protein
MQWPWLACAALLLLTNASCAREALCGGPEVCNYADDNCNGHVDETFVNAEGVYFTADHCGACNVRCSEVYPTAASTECHIDRTGSQPFAECRILACPPATHLVGTSYCAPDAPALCLPCTTDHDCALRVPNAHCEMNGMSQGRCSIPCSQSGPDACPTGFVCASTASGASCIPSNGDCSCNASTMGVEFGCFVHAPDGHACAGVQMCSARGAEMCRPVLDETCNSRDDNCDGSVDESFRDAQGRYVDDANCGSCGTPCAPPGPHMVAHCVTHTTSDAPSCDVQCEDGFVDVDHLAVTGCECRRAADGGPPPVVGGDGNCDGVPDDTSDFVYVTTNGSDTNPGTLLRPMRTIQAALARGLAEGKTVLVATGLYEGFDLVAGVDVYGGYAPDFTDRSLDLYPVRLVQHPGRPGLPVVTCHDVARTTRVEGFEVRASAATAAGEGSTAMAFDGCTAAVQIADVQVLAARGADGALGTSSSEHLAELGLGSLAQLNGTDGSEGAIGTPDGAVCSEVAGGNGGAKQCGSVSIAGGHGGAASCNGPMCFNGSPCGNAGCDDFTSGGVCDVTAVMRAAVANPAPTAGQGTAGGRAGALSYNAPTDRATCFFCNDNPSLNRFGADGDDGAAGIDGAAGAGCSGASRFDANTGTARGDDGTDGTAGGNGSGGGGASAGAGFLVIGGTEAGCASQSGGSGGGGGSGGCGAPRTTGGGGGGTSIGIAITLALGTSEGPAFDRVRVITGSGGAGGDGGIGAGGGANGIGAAGGIGVHWCARGGGRGGDGGHGGAAGGGGGGCGGGSHGIYARGAASTAYLDTLRARVQIETTGVPGRRGEGGYSPGHAGTPGRDGNGDPIFVE